MKLNRQYMLMVEIAIALEDALRELMKDSEAATNQFNKLKENGHIDALEDVKYTLDAMGLKRRDGKPFAW